MQIYFHLPYMRSEIIESRTYPKLIKRLSKFQSSIGIITAEREIGIA